VLCPCSFKAHIAKGRPLAEGESAESRTAAGEAFPRRPSRAPRLLKGVRAHLRTDGSGAVAGRAEGEAGGWRPNGK